MADAVVKTEVIETKVPAVEGEQSDAKVETTEGEEGENSEVVLTDEQKEQVRLKEEARQQKQSKLDKRFKELTGKVKARTVEADTWREMVAEVSGEPAPDKADYKTNEEYLDAMADYREKIRAPKVNLQLAEKQVDTAEKEYTEALANSWQERIDDLKEEIPDYAAVVKAAKLNLTPAMHKTILRLGPQLAYALAQDPDKAQEIYDLPADEQILELGALNSKVQAGRKVAPVKVEKQKVPPKDPPSNEVKGDKAPKKKDPGEMDLEEFAAWRKKGGGK